MNRKMGDKKSLWGKYVQRPSWKDGLLYERRLVPVHMRIMRSLSELRLCLMIVPIVSRI